MGSAVQSFVDALRIGAPISAGGIAFYPLVRKGGSATNIELLEDAIARGVIEVRETGKVNELEAVNRSDKPILILEGDIVQGGRQNRVINTTFVVPGRATVKVPASCVERGRWQGDEKTFTLSGFMVSPMVKSSLKRSVSDSVRVTRGISRASDQGAVWDRTEDSLQDSRAISRTQDHLEAYRARGETLDKDVKEVCAAIEKAGPVAGVVIVRGDRRAAVEAFGSDSIAIRVLPRIVRAHLLVAPPGKPPEDAPSKLLEEVKQAPTTASAGAGGVGEEIRFEKARMSGLAFVLDALTVHLNADWSDEPRDAGQKTVILRRPPQA